MQEPLLIEDLAVSAIGTRYAELRIVKPIADRLLEKSIRQYGQMLPVVCVRSGAGYELIDGFKRLRASIRLGRTTLSARIKDEMSERACKAAVVQLNQTSRSISDLEEALVLQSLYRQDGMKQPEIAVLFGRDKSWVSRRLSLVEKLHEEVRKNIMLGLLPMVCGRELARLPRGNQDEALACVLKHRLTTRETAKLTSYLLSHPNWEHHPILASPWELLDRELKLPPVAFQAKLFSMRKSCGSVTDEVKAGAGIDWGKSTELMESAVLAAREAIAALTPYCAQRGNQF